MSSLLSSHPISLLLLAQQRIERYLRLQELGIRECSYEAPLVEEEIALLEEIDLRNWLFGFGAGIRIESPIELRQEHQQRLQETLAVYQEIHVP